MCPIGLGTIVGILLDSEKDYARDVGWEAGNCDLKTVCARRFNGMSKTREWWQSIQQKADSEMVQEDKWETFDTEVDLMQLTTEQLATWERDGIIVVPNVFPQEVIAPALEEI